MTNQCFLKKSISSQLVGLPELEFCKDFAVAAQILRKKGFPEDLADLIAQQTIEFEEIEDTDLEAAVYSSASCTLTWCSSVRRPATCG